MAISSIFENLITLAHKRYAPFFGQSYYIRFDGHMRLLGFEGQNCEELHQAFCDYCDYCHLDSDSISVSTWLDIFDASFAGSYYIPTKHVYQLEFTYNQFISLYRWHQL